MWSLETIVFMAAIIDGEGSMLIDLQSPGKSRKYHYFNIRLIITNTNTDLMDWLVKHFGGIARKRKIVTGRKQCYSWTLFSKDACEIIKTCFPYFIIKKHHAPVILEFMDTVGKTGWNVTPEVREHRKFLYNRIRELNKTGSETIDPCALSPSA